MSLYNLVLQSNYYLIPLFTKCSPEVFYYSIKTYLHNCWIAKDTGLFFPYFFFKCIFFSHTKYSTKFSLTVNEIVLEDLYWFIVAEDLFHNLIGITHRKIDGVIISYFLFGFVTHFHKLWNPVPCKSELNRSTKGGDNMWGLEFSLCSSKQMSICQKT